MMERRISMKNNRKILFFDIDGTLLTPPPFTVPESARKALNLAREQGHLAFINSGRTFAMIPDTIKELGFDGYVCGCGSQIYLNGELLYSSSIPNETCRETIQALRDYRIAAFFESSDKILFDGCSPVQSEAVTHLKKLVPTEDISLYDETKEHSYTFDKFLAFLQPDSDENAFIEFCRDKYVYFDHGRHTWEVTQKDLSKATGIRFLLDHLGLPLESSYAFGDSTNDLPMLKYAGNSIAMGNAMEEILPYCSYQTTDIEDNGIYNALSHFGLI